MTAWMRRCTGGAIVAALTAGTLAVPASGQQSTNRVATETDWSVFVEESPQRECWAVTAPKTVAHTRNGSGVPVQRGSCSLQANDSNPGSDCNILLFATIRAGSQQPEISFSGGYPFAPNSTVEVQIGSDNFELFTDEGHAWPSSAAEDGRLLAAMRRGAEAVVTGRSARGTVTRDTFSLLGFTAALGEAESRCRS
jgi:hypothetical protein